jgi:hypothetical protein
MGPFRWGKMKSKKSKMLDIADILEENYYTLGVSGADAIVDIYDEIEAGHFDNQIIEWGISRAELYECVAMLRQRMTAQGKIKPQYY